MATEETRVAIDHDVDIVAARRKARELAKQVGFSGTDLTLIATAISEVARNIVAYADRGEIPTQAFDGPVVPFHEHASGRAAAEGFQSKSSAPGKKIEETGPRQSRRQARKNRLPQAVG